MRMKNEVTGSLVVVGEGVNEEAPGEQSKGKEGIQQQSSLETAISTVSVDVDVSRSSGDSSPGGAGDDNEGSDDDEVQDPPYVSSEPLHQDELRVKRSRVMRHSKQIPPNHVTVNVKTHQSSPSRTLQHQSRTVEIPQNGFTTFQYESQAPEIIVKDERLLDSDDDAGDFISMDFTSVTSDDDEEDVTPATSVCLGGSCPCEGGKWRDIVHGRLEPRLKLHPCDDMAKHYKTLQERNRTKASKVPAVVPKRLPEPRVGVEANVYAGRRTGPPSPPSKKPSVENGVFYEHHCFSHM
jgi:hypothetical protein